MGASVLCGGAVVPFQLCLLLACITVVVGAVENHDPPPRKRVAVQGVVYCQDCMLDPTKSRLVPKQTPIPGAVVKLQCNNTRKGWEEEAKTDGGGEFLLKPLKVTTWGAHKCNLFLVSSPMYNCSSTGNPYPEPDGAPWIFGRPLTPIKINNAASLFQFYTSAWPLLYYPNWSACI